jgi:hypothetical protein
VEAELGRQGRSLEQATLEETESLWQQSKQVVDRKAAQP